MGRWWVSVFVMLALAGCGQKGDLYLPDRASAQQGMVEKGAR